MAWIIPKPTTTEDKIHFATIVLAGISILATITLIPKNNQPKEETPPIMQTPFGQAYRQLDEQHRTLTLKSCDESYQRVKSEIAYQTWMDVCIRDRAATFLNYQKQQTKTSG